MAARFFVWPLFRLETEGRENLPRDTGFILLPKHQRWEDIPLLGLASPRPLYYVAKAELFQNRISSWFLSSLGGIGLNRGRPMESRRGLARMIQLLREGEGVVVFPEGTYYPGRMGPGRPGVVRMAGSRLKLPFIPVGVQYVPGNPRTRVRIRFGEALPGNGQSDMEQFLGQAMACIARLSGLNEPC